MRSATLAIGDNSIPLKSWLWRSAPKQVNCSSISFGRHPINRNNALVIGVHLLRVNRILVVPHTKCSMAKYTEDELRAKISESSGQDASWQSFGVIHDQLAAVEEDIKILRSHPLIPDSVAIGGFLYDVDTGLLEQKA